MKKLLLLIAIVASFASCKKENVIATGKIRYTNYSQNDNRYEIFLDGASLGLLKANAYIEKSVNVGTHSVKATQYEGYAFYPTIKEASLTVGKDGSVEFVFP